MSRHLMAKMNSGKQKLAGWANWSPQPRTHEYDELNFHKAPLETGHELHVWTHDTDNDVEDSWNWAIHDPSQGEYGDLISAGPDANDTAKDTSTVAHADHIGGIDEAKRQAEQAYEKMFPINKLRDMKHPTRGDSNIDYSDLNRFMDES